MKRIAVVFLVLCASLPIAAGNGERLAVTIPLFTTPSEAIMFAQGRIAAADANQSEGQKALLEAASAYSQVQKTAGATPDEVFAAGLGGAEAFLRLGAGRAAMNALATIPPAVVQSSARKYEYLERSGEASELYKDGYGAQTFEKAVRECANCPAGWKALLRYRAGIAAMLAGRDTAAAVYLEQSLLDLPGDTFQAIVARATLARAYAHTGDADRATAQLAKARQDKGRQLHDAALPRTFLADPKGADLDKYLDDTDKIIQDARINGKR